MAGYLQDDWKITGRLTLNIGVRYDLQKPRTERHNMMSDFDQNAPSPIASLVHASADCPGCGNLKGAMTFMNANHRTQVPLNSHDFAPRIGFAYRLSSNLVMRGGYGIAYVPSPMQAAATAGTMMNEGYATTSTFYSTKDSMHTVFASLRNPFPNGFNLPTGNSLGAATDFGTSSILVIDSTRSPYVQQWNFNLQRMLPGKLLAEVTYIGNHGIFLTDGDGGHAYDQLPASYMAYGATLGRTVPNPFYGIITDPTSGLSGPTVSWSQLQRPFPQYTSVSSNRTPTANSIYHGMTVRADKRFSRGMNFLVAYTTGKAIDDASNGVTYLGPVSYSRLDAYNRRLERAVSSQDISQRFVTSASYELPVGKGKRFFPSAPRGANLLISGWQVNLIGTLQHGTPLFITVPQDNANIYTTSQRANNNGHSAHLSGGSASQRIAEWFDTSVFSQPQNYTFGDTGRNLPDVRGPGQHNMDLSIFKNTQFGPDRKLNLQYRVEMFNAFNSAQFAAPGVTLAAANFGVITADAVAPRQIQMALKLLW